MSDEPVSPQIEEPGDQGRPEGGRASKRFEGPGRGSAPRPRSPLEGSAALYRGTGLSPAVKALGAASLFQDVASEMVYPLLPRFLVSLGGGPVLLGLMESLAEGVLAIVKGAAGRWSDRSGVRKPFVAAGYGVSALTRPLLALASTGGHVVALRTLDRLAKGLRTAPRDALIAEATPAASRGFAFAFHRGLDHLGAAIGPLAAALVLALAPGRVRLVFALATIPALAGWATVQLGIRAGRRASEAPVASMGPMGPLAPMGPGEAGGVPGGPPPLRVPPGLRRPLLAFFLFSLGNASDAFLLLRASELGYTPIGLTLLWSGFHITKWAASAPGGRLADRLGPRRPILAGWGLYALVYLGFGWTADGLVLALLMLAYAAYYGLTEGAERALVVSLGAREAGTGTALGAFHLATGLGVFAASLAFGLVWQAASPAAAFTFGAALAAGAAAVLAAAPAPRS